MNYRLYCFDGAGRLWVADGFGAADDAEAIELAQRMDEGVKCELWEGHRFVAAIASGGTGDRLGPELA